MKYSSKSSDIYIREVSNSKPCGHSNWHGSTLIPAWISSDIQYNVWGGITYPFPNFNGYTVEVWEWMNKFIPHFTLLVWLFDGIKVKPC